MGMTGLAQTCFMMQLMTLTLLSLAQYGALGAPLGALESSVAQDGLLPPLGAPRTFELFYPSLPSATPAPAEETSPAVPVIHLPEDDAMENYGKAAADAYLDMFPRDLLESNKKVRPIDVRIIEHDGYIDYEIEFVELSEEQYDEYDSDSAIETGHASKDDSDKQQSDSTNVEVTTQKIATTIPDSTAVTAVTFVDLLMRARRKHRQKISQEEQKNRARTVQQGTLPFGLETTESNFKLEAELDDDKSATTSQPSVMTVAEQPKT